MSVLLIDVLFSTPSCCLLERPVSVDFDDGAFLFGPLALPFVMCVSSRPELGSSVVSAFDPSEASPVWASPLNPDLLPIGDCPRASNPAKEGLNRSDNLLEAPGIKPPAKRFILGGASSFDEVRLIAVLLEVSSFCIIPSTAGVSFRVNGGLFGFCGNSGFAFSFTLRNRNKASGVLDSVSFGFSNGSWNVSSLLINFLFISASGVLETLGFSIGVLGPSATALACISALRFTRLSLSSSTR